jgi:hypothetical protein
MITSYECNTCDECGANFIIDCGGVTVHLDEDGEYDYGADGDHVAYSMEDDDE